MANESPSEFIARQLNDHHDSPSGVVHNTYFAWHENHINEAVDKAVDYVYSLVPQDFGRKKKKVIQQETCVVDLTAECSKFIDVLSLKIGDNDCVNLKGQEDYETNSLMDLLKGPCVKEEDSSDEPEDGDDLSFSWKLGASSSSPILVFNKVLPRGSVLSYICAAPPEDGFAGLTEGLQAEYGGFIADLALFWLYRTDNESVSNLERANLHYRACKDFMLLKLKLEFSLNEDDSFLGNNRIYELKTDGG